MFGGLPDLLTINVCLGISAGLLALMYRWERGRSTLFYLGCFFALFAFGPVVNYLLGNPIYFGIAVEHLDRASVGFTIALAGIATADRLTARRADTSVDATVPSTRRYVIYPFVLLALVAYGTVTTLRILPVTLSADKLEQVSAAGPGHSPYLVLELCAVSTYFIACRSPLFSNLWRINLIAYVVYCLATSERDFLFAGFSVFLHRQMSRGRGGPPVKVVLVAFGSILAASFLFASRAGERLGVTGILNQGSIPFVDTFVLELVPSTFDFAYGQTYLQALRGLPPSAFYDSGTVNLSTWLVNLYAPGSRGGYGFSLSGEAYMNFGLPGVFAVFFALGLLVRAANRRVGTSEWGTYWSVYITAVTMYALRVDSAQLFKSMVYGAIFFVVIRTLDSRDGRWNGGKWHEPHETLPATPRAASTAPPGSVAARRHTGGDVGT